MIWMGVKLLVFLMNFYFMANLVITEFHNVSIDFFLPLKLYLAITTHTDIHRDIYSVPSFKRCINSALC